MNIKTLKRKNVIRVGTTLIEVVVSSLLVAIVLVTSLRSTAVIHSSTIQADQNVLFELAANSLLEELRALRYSEDSDSKTLGPDENERSSARETWDDCDDAIGYSTSRLRRRDGTLWGDGNISARISGKWFDPETLSTTSEETGLKIIEIAVGIDRSRYASISALFSKTPTLKETSVSLLDMTIKQADGTTISVLASPRNRATISTP